MQEADSQGRTRRTDEAKRIRVADKAIETTVAGRPKARRDAAKKLEAVRLQRRLDAVTERTAAARKSRGSTQDRLNTVIKRTAAYRKVMDGKSTVQEDRALANLTERMISNVKGEERVRRSTEASNKMVRKARNSRVYERAISVS